MSKKYSTGVRFNHHMGLLETLSFLGEGIGAALFVTAVATGRWALGVLGVVFVCGAVVSLLAHLGMPRRSWRAIARLATSWVSRGSFAISAFIGVATLSLAAGHFGWPQPYAGGLELAAVLLSIPVMVYGGVLLRSMRAIRLWRGPFLPLVFVAHSLASAFTVTLALARWSGDGAVPGWLQQACLAGLLLAATLSLVHLARAERSIGVKASLERLLAGDLRLKLVLGAALAGIVVPFAAVLASGNAQAQETTSALLALAALCRLYGDFAYRNAIVLAGAYEPIMPAGPNRALGAVPAATAGPARSSAGAPGRIERATPGLV